MPVTVTNLSTLANTHAEGRVIGSKLPHADIAFTFDGTNKSFNMDDWTNCKTPSKTRLAAAITGGAIATATVESSVKAWTCDGSLFADLLDFVYFANGQAANWVNPGGSGASVTFTLRQDAPLADDNQRELFMLLAAGSASMFWRENTASALDTDSMDVTIPDPNVKPALKRTTRIQYNWAKLLRELRITARARILAKTAPPAYDDAGRTKLDSIVFETVEDRLTGGFKTLLKNGLVRREPHGLGYEYLRTDNCHLGSTKDLHTGCATQLTKCFNHYRFVFYCEWRIGYELSRWLGPTMS